MIELFVALGLSAGAADTPNKDELSQCLAYLARAPEYNSLSNDDLARHHGFLESAEGSYCSDESSPFWKGAHQKARAKLGASTEGRPVEGQQELAEQEMRLILTKAWLEAGKYRTQPNLFPKFKMFRFVKSWLLDDRNSEEVNSLIETPVQCFRVKFQKVSGVKPEDFMAGMENLSFRKIGTHCGYEAAQNALAAKLNTRFPDMGAELVGTSINSFLGEMTFWATLSQ